MPIVSKQYITFFLGKSANSYVRSPFVGAGFSYSFLAVSLESTT